MTERDGDRDRTQMFQVELPGGSRLGRMNLTSMLGPVAPAFAYSWPFPHARDMAEAHGGRVMIAECERCGNEVPEQQAHLVELASPRGGNGDGIWLCEECDPRDEPEPYRGRTPYHLSDPF